MGMGGLVIEEKRGTEDLRFNLPPSLLVLQAFWWLPGNSSIGPGKSQ